MNISSHLLIIIQGMVMARKSKTFGKFQKIIAKVEKQLSKSLENSSIWLRGEHFG